MKPAGRRRLGGVSWLWAAAALWGLACGGSAGAGRGGGPGGTLPEAARRAPATRHIPADASYALAATRLDRVTGAFRDLLRPIDAGGRSLLELADEELRQELGFSLLDAADLAEIGLAVDRSVAFFATGVLPTVLLPVEDRSRVEAALGRLVAKTTVLVKEHLGELVTTWRDGPWFQVSYVLLELDGQTWLAVHFGSEKLEAEPMAWLEAVKRPGFGLAGEGDVAWAMEAAGPDAAVFGVVRAETLGAALRAVDDLVGTRRDGAACDELDARAAGVFGRIALYARLAEGKVEGGAIVELSPEARGALARRLAPPPDAAYRAVRGEAAAYVSVGVDLDWVSQLGRDFGKRGCGTLPALLRELELFRLGDPVTSIYGQRVLASYHLALLSARVVGRSLMLDAAGFFSVPDEGSLKSMLRAAMFLMPGLNRSSRQVGGETVTTLDLSSQGLADALEYHVGGGALRLAMGKGVMDRLLSPGPGGGASGEVVAFGLRPAQIEDLAKPLAWIGGQSGMASWETEIMARLLSAFRWFGFSVVLEDAGLRVTGGFQLR